MNTSKVVFLGKHEETEPPDEMQVKGVRSVKQKGVRYTLSPALDEPQAESDSNISTVMLNSVQLKRHLCQGA